MSIKHTFCRICEPACGLLARIDNDGQIAALLPDPNHISGGRPCHKGLSFLDVHRDPDRLNWPLKRRNPRREARGAFDRVEWDASLADVARRLNALREQHGPNSVAIYYGNPFGVANAAGWAAVEPLRQAIGTQMIFSAGTQDVTNKTAAGAEIYGSSGVLTIPDIANTHYLLCIGANPLVSRWTAMSHPNDDLASLRAIVDRGGKVVFVNPRKIESSTPATGPTLQIRPGTDVYFLAALFLELDSRGAFDEARIASLGKRMNELRLRIKGYTADVVEAIVGIQASQIRSIAADIAAAPSAAIYISTGVNQSRQGTLAYLLSEMINFGTGNLGRKGGVIKPAGIVDHFARTQGVATVETSIGTFELPEPIGAATLPAATITRLIESGDIRALLVFGGNPILTVGGEEQMRRAYESLDLLVSVDVFRSATGELADYVLPAADWLEHSDLTLLGSGLQPQPYVQYTEAMVPPAHERRNGWWILNSLISALGAPSALDVAPDDHDGHSMFAEILKAAGLTIDDLMQSPGNARPIDQKPPESFFERCVVHPDGKIDCCPEKFIERGLFDRMASIFAELRAEAPGALKMISLRTRYMHNSWMGNAPRINHAIRGASPVHVSPEDANARALLDGDIVRIFNDVGSVKAQVRIDADLPPGTIAMTHGYGQRLTYGMTVASAVDGANCNALLPTDDDDIEPVSYMSWMTAVPVELVSAEPVRTYEGPGLATAIVE
ncbi:molybdopterin-dependent oxidoreductase [Sphingobium sp. HBC34]|uniref:Molybdopterin-dependent oxidoreductase n=1 Tax=Sphingobium cyanobacteriorum TaxID=3063954 RepID=A0ABT8ZPN1_9SPHN|nr:molybdopterin-dependent oxidoreductase [Sphingobium sp. HBC34]MDO7836461.1 molybdopterin-dependent oxidoreductase [Sphingobium sp. HBC34]